MCKKSYLKAIVICHGKSEKQMCEFIKSNLRIKIEVISEKKGEKSIQINSIMHILNGMHYKSFDNFSKKFSDVEVIKRKTKKQLVDTFKVFIIMDTDDCNTEAKHKYINGTMFKTHWLRDYIVPIYNCPELESVLSKAKIPFSKTGDARKQEYVKIFPTDERYLHNDYLQIRDFCKALEKCNTTNMNEFLSFCLRLVEA